MLLLGCPLKEAYGMSPKNKAQLREEDTTVPRDKDANDKNQTKPCDDLGQMKEQHLRVVNELRNEISKIKHDNLSKKEIKDVSSIVPSSKPQLVEAFASGNDEFNELLLYIFTGIFFIIMFDYMYKFGKKSY